MLIVDKFSEESGMVDQIAVICFSFLAWEITQLNFSRTDHASFSFQS